jgi:hypothetical protein
MQKTFLRTLRGLTVVVLIAASTVAMYSCYPNSPESAEEFDVVATFYDQEANFSGFSTFYSRTDSIIQIEIPGAQNLVISHDYDKKLLKQISDKFISRGYSRVADPQATKPEMAVLVSAAATTEYDPYASNPWFDFWGGWFADSLGVNVDVTWGLDYSWYTGSVVYSYDVGALVVMLLDIRNVDDTTARADIPVLWMGSFNGLLSGSNVSIESRVSTAIDQMFEQSPYLIKTGQ